MSGRPDLEEVRKGYQVADGEMILWSPKVGGFEAAFLGEANLTRTEGEMLDQLTVERGLFGLNQFRGFATDSFEEARDRFPDNAPPEDIPAEDRRAWQSNDGHRDAFRHTYWNALLARQYGEDWTQAFATAHEGLPGNAANREAMDLYNNEVGRRIATENPDATPEQLANLVERAVKDGTVIVIDRDGDLAWSDQVTVGRHGMAKEGVLAPAMNAPQPEPLPRGMSADPVKRPPTEPAEPARAAPEAGHSRESSSVSPVESDQRFAAQGGPSDPNNPDYAMLAQIREGVRRIDAGIGKPFDEASECLGRCLLPECKSTGLIAWTTW